MLCEVCNNIEFSLPGRNPASSPKLHHASLENLIASAKNGCDLCKLIVKEENVLSTPSHRPDRKNIDEPAQIFYQFYPTDNFHAPSDHPLNLGSSRCQDIHFFQEYKAGRGTVLYVTFDLFVDDDSLLAQDQSILGRVVQERPDSEACFNLIERWMHICHTEHNDSCLRASNSLLPSRVIDVGPPDGSQLPKVIVSGTVVAAWVSLSHCWGSSITFVLDSQNQMERMRGIPIDQMPATFIDAIRVTRRFGFRYLWIDSLCILQDSEEDWVAESCLMQRYYEDASLTIASDSVSGDHQSFLDLSRSKDKNAVALPVRLHHDSGSSLTPKDVTESLFFYVRSKVGTFHSLAFSVDSVLSNRAWTLQEEFFSPRTIHYASDQLLWECRKGKMTEAQRFMLTPGTYYRGLDLKNVSLSYTENLVLGNRWYIIVEAYVPRLLTYPTDKFTALSALARYMARHTGFTYKAGIWLEDYHFGLLWFCLSPETRFDRYIAPTWSWASLKTQFPYMRIEHPKRAISDSSIQRFGDKRVALISCEVSLKGPDEFGPLLSGTIRLRGSCILSQELQSLPIGQLSFFHGKVREPEQETADIMTVFCYFDEPLQISEKTTNPRYENQDLIHPTDLRNICFLYITTASYPEGFDWPKDQEGNISYFLLLRSVDNTGQFRRLGVAQMLVDTYLAMQDSWKMTEVTII